MKAFKPFFLLTLFFLLQPVALAYDLTFTAVSGVNLKSDTVNNSMTPSIEKLLKVKDDINASGSDFVLFLGNNIGGANPFDLVMFAKVIKKIHKPVYVGIGNRDTQKTKHLEKKEYYRLLNKYSKNKISKLPSAKKIGDFVFIFMDGTNEMVSMPRGYFKDREFVELEKYLKKYKDKDVIIVQHFPVLKLKNELKSTFNAEEYTKFLSAYPNVKAVISGIEGEDFEIEKDGIKHINVPSLDKASEYKVFSIKSNNNGLFIKTKIISVD